MKKTLLLVPLLCISTGVWAKVTYEDALESARPYEEALAAVHNPPDDFGLSDNEVPDGSHGEYGHWTELGKKEPTGVTSFIMLLGPSDGYQCSPVGAYGIRTYESCPINFNCRDIDVYYLCE
ncbi:hypothetical protein [uncultured Vibrio sp.]|uniref:hypothetical protein n=1 Tax=uncultured Vibrio sp. TaxID=114054 RepID=UPI00261AAAD3|nr:hypothetical protein [uncultured Vibrio sp.]